MREYHRRPKVKDRHRNRMREYNRKPGVKEHKREYEREHERKPEVKERRRERERNRRRKPEVKDREREYQRERYYLRAAEREAGYLTKLIKELARITKELDSNGSSSNRKP